MLKFQKSLNLFSHLMQSYKKGNTVKSLLRNWKQEVVMEIKRLRTDPPQVKMTKKMHIAEMQAILQSNGVALSDETVSAVYGAFVDSIGAALSDGLSVTVPGLGRFETRYRRPKSFTPPHLASPIHLNERYVPFFVAGKKLKRLVWERPVISEHRSHRRSEPSHRRGRLFGEPYDPDEDEIFDEDEFYR